MRCPYCDQDNDKVIDSRATEGGKAIRRRRECLACGKRFTTYEHIETAIRITVIKRDNSRLPYDREKIRAGIEKACYKRPVSAEQIARIVDEVEEEIFRKGEREVPSVEIGQLVADRLKKLDQVAYVRFASVYKQFRDLDDLLDEVRDMLQTGPDIPGQGKLF
ncbi:MAG: transcriptional repressor NrdR [Phycisphaerales bacterium]|nr:transcriptional repressor NrdR [Phycisphaerales bacterium]